MVYRFLESFVKTQNKIKFYIVKATINRFSNQKDNKFSISLRK